MKKFYVEAELEVINLLNADIITASGGGSVSGGPATGDTEGSTDGMWS